jgi:nucleoside-diphosphate-sugar epimerase
MKKILVTGASGFLGEYVIEYLLGKGYSIIATSSSVSKASKKKWFERVNYIPFDLNNFDSGKNYFTFFQKPDLVIHLAWAGLPNYKSDFHLNVNLPLQSAFLKNLM